MLPAGERGGKGVLLARMPPKAAHWAFPRAMPFSLLAAGLVEPCHPCLNASEAGQRVALPPFKMGQAGFPVVLRPGLCPCSWDCPVCGVGGRFTSWSDTWVWPSSRPALPRPPGAQASERGGGRGSRLERADGCGHLRGMVRNGIGEGTFPQATAEQGLQDTAGLDTWAEGCAWQRAASAGLGGACGHAAWLLCANLCHLQAAPGRLEWRAGPGPTWEGQ